MLLALVLAFATLQADDVTVFVFTATDPSGFTDPLQAQRVEAVANLKTEIEKKKGLTVTETKDVADLVVEVVDAGKLATGATRTKGLSTGLDGAVFGTTTRQETKPQVHAVLRAGTYQLEFQGSASNMKRAAGAVADGVEKWVKQNRAKLTK